MRTLTVAEFISLDGVVQAPGGPEEDREGGFRHGGWIVPFADEAIGRTVHDLVSRPFELLLGRRTYDIWADYWPKVPAGHAMADRFNATIKHVATHRPAALGWSGSRALQGELVSAVSALKLSFGPDLLIWGSAQVAGQLIAAGLVDSLTLMTYPVVLGGGKRLFPTAGAAREFSLLDSSTTPGGVIIARYRRGGELRTGEFEGARGPE